MLRRSFAALMVAALALAASAQDKSRSIVCMIFTVAGDSAEGSALYQKYMALQPEILRSYLPAHFELGKKGFLLKAQGDFGFSAEDPEPLERYGHVVLNSVKVELRSPPPPAAWKTTVVEMQVADLAAARELVQPGTKAIELAALKLKLKKGSAWIESIERPSPGKIKATVAFLKK